MQARMNHEALIARQRSYFTSGATRSLEFRRAALERLGKAIESREQEILTALQADLGKPSIDAWTAEIGLVLGEIRHAVKHLKKWMKPRRAKVPMLAWPGKAQVGREPCGVVLILGPWNYPFQLVLSPLVGAIAGGNCAVLKPSELSPHTTAVIAKLARESFPEELIAVVEGEHEISESLLKEKFDHIFFTGSTSVGRAVMLAAAKHLTPVTLELGGKCPAIVCGLDDSKSIETAARRLAWGKFMNAGQTCVAPDHVWVERSIHDVFVEAVGRISKEFFGPESGHLINRRHFDRVVAFLQDGTISSGGEYDATNLFLEPTILTDVSPQSPVMQEEIFGPVLPVLAFDSLDEVLAEIGSRPSPLAVYVFSNDESVKRKVIEETRSGGVCVNDSVVHITGHDLPFGGLGDSGMGRYHGKASFDCFTHERVVLSRSLAFDPDFRYPPPKLSLAKLKKLLRIFG
jgi:aldehyde dehydrogenase (NAD+)